MKNISTKNHFKRSNSRKLAWLVFANHPSWSLLSSVESSRKIEINSNMLKKYETLRTP